jgi:hypothetical protein
VGNHVATLSVLLEVANLVVDAWSSGRTVLQPFQDTLSFPKKSTLGKKPCPEIVVVRVVPLVLTRRRWVERVPERRKPSD